MSSKYNSKWIKTQENLDIKKFHKFIQILIEKTFIQDHSEIKQLIITGSFGRDEGIIVKDGKRFIIISDLDLLALVNPINFYKIFFKLKEKQRILNSFLKVMKYPFLGPNFHISLKPVTKKRLIVLKPKIFNYYTSKGTKVLWGENLNFKITRNWSINNISKGEYTRLILNRMIEFIDFLSKFESDSNKDKIEFVYQLTKMYTSLMVVLLFNIRLDPVLNKKNLCLLENWYDFSQDFWGRCHFFLKKLDEFKIGIIPNFEMISNYNNVINLINILKFDIYDVLVTLYTKNSEYKEKFDFKNMNNLLLNNYFVFSRSIVERIKFSIFSLFFAPLKKKFSFARIQLKINTEHFFQYLYLLYFGFSDCKAWSSELQHSKKINIAILDKTIEKFVSFQSNLSTVEKLQKFREFIEF